MATIDLGRLGFVNKGTYNNSTTYEKNDLVQFTDGGILSTYLYIDSTAQSGQAPSSSGTAGSRWVYFAKGVADAVSSAGNNKVLVTDGSGILSPVAIGSAGQILKVNSGANGFEFGADQGGKILKVYNNTDTSNISTNSTSYQDTGLSITLTPTSASNDFLIIADLGVTRHASTSASMFVQIMRDSTAVVAHGNGYMGYSGNTNDRGYYPSFFHHLDVPNSTSSITYKIQYKSESSGASVHSYGSRRMTIFEIDGGIE